MPRLDGFIGTFRNGFMLSYFFPHNVRLASLDAIWLQYHMILFLLLTFCCLGIAPWAKLIKKSTWLFHLIGDKR